MCCFSGPVTFVRGTRIFARITEPGRQAIVYQMEFGAKQDLAMILPLPVAAGSDEKALKFIDAYRSVVSDVWQQGGAMTALPAIRVNSNLYADQ